MQETQRDECDDLEKSQGLDEEMVARENMYFSAKN